MDLDALSYEVIGACIEVHKCTGPGMLESAYEMCVAHELEKRGLTFERQVPVAVDYKGLHLPNAYRVDMVVDKRIVLELKTVERLQPIHEAQILTYLRLGNFRSVCS
jgi:GxxExxY protein